MILRPNKNQTIEEDFIMAKPIKTMLIICFLDIREIVNAEFILSCGQTVSHAFYK